jgi:arylsulfatase A-like enzyme
VFRQRSAAPVATAALLLLIAAAACAPRTPPRRSLLLVTIDTLRSDRLGAYGNPRVLTPTLDRLATRGVSFANATSQIPSTLPSHASILTGRYPTAHGVHDNGVYLLDPSETTLAELLTAEGYETAAFVSAFVLDRRFGLDQGFARYGDRMEDALRRGEAPAFDAAANPVTQWWVGSWFGAYQRRAESAVREAAEWLRTRGGAAAGRPFFLWVHLFDPHEPYDAPAPLGSMYDRAYGGLIDGTGVAFAAARAAGSATAADIAHMRARYDAEVTYADRSLGALLDTLAAMGLAGETIVAVTADHGEGMGEHDYYFEHGSRLWEPLLRVPLVIAGPGLPRGTIADGRVRSVDLFPTLLDLLGVAAPEGIDGVALDLRADGRRVVPAAADRDAYAETQCGLQALPTLESYRAIASGRWKLIATTSRDPAAAGAAPRVALYDLDADAGETSDLARERPRIARDLFDQLARIVLESAADTTARLNTRAMDDETVAKLRALGYVR